MEACMRGSIDMQMTSWLLTMTCTMQSNPIHMTHLALKVGVMSPFLAGGAVCGQLIVFR